jgi:D-alanine-D-alanine ligase
MKIALLYDETAGGDISPDNADIVEQIEVVSSGLRELGHGFCEIPFSLDLKRAIDSLEKYSPDLVFNLVESVEGNGDLIFMAPALLDSMNIPYTGSSTDTIYKSSNKLLAKEHMSGNSVPTPEGFSMKKASEKSQSLKGDYIIKSVWEHASIGINDDSIVSPCTTSDLLMEMEFRKNELGGRCFAEKYIEGREFNLSILAGKEGPEILPPAEIEFKSFSENRRRMVGYSAKWEQESFEYSNTVRRFEFSERDDHLLGVLRKVAERCWNIFDIGGYCRVDFRVDKKRRPWVLEVNANPCLSPDAGFMAAAERAGIEPADVIKRIIEDAI